MSNSNKGILVLKDVPHGEAEEKVVRFLSRFSKKGTTERLKEKVRNTPFVLSKDIPAEKAELIVEALQKLGASTTFVPHTHGLRPSAEENTAFESPPVHVPELPRRLTKELIPDKPAPKKNETRRRIMILTIILFILSLGFLAWQFYPLIADKLRDLGLG